MYETSREVIRIWSTRPLPHALSFHRHLEPHTYTPTHILHPYDTAHAALKGDTAETKIHLLDQLKSRLKRKKTLKKRCDSQKHPPFHSDLHPFRPRNQEVTTSIIPTPFPIFLSAPTDLFRLSSEFFPERIIV